MSKKSNWSFGLVIILTLWWFFNVVFSVLSAATEGVIFQHKTGDILRSHLTQVVPDDYAFMAWILVFLWLLIGYLFVIVAFVRDRSRSSGWVETLSSSDLVSPCVSALLILNSALYTSWLFVWDNQYIIAASAILFCIVGTSWIALALLCFNLEENTLHLQRRSPVILYCYRILVQNGLGVYAAWITIASLINLAIVLKYDADMSEPTPSLIALGLLTAIVAVWMPLDVFLLDKYCRYMVTPLFGVLWALFGIFVRQQNENYENNAPKYFNIGLIGAVSVLLTGRIFLTAFRAVKYPL